MTFQDLILIYWVNRENPEDKTQWTQEFTNLADTVAASRYYVPPSPGAPHSGQQCVIIDTVEDITTLVKQWISRSRYADNKPPTVYFGFQGGPGWTLPEFHDILRVTTKLPILVPGIVVSWLPDNWFMHPGLTPNLTSGEHALEWLEQQEMHHKPEEIIYEFKG